MEVKSEPPTGGNTSNATPGLIGMSFLFAVALFVYGIRMYTRCRPIFKLAASGYLVSASLVSTYNAILRGAALICITGLRINLSIHPASKKLPQRFKG